MTNKNHKFTNSTYTTQLLKLTLTKTLLLFILLITTKKCTSTSTNPKPFTKIYAFGDSYTDTGNTVSTTGPSGFNYVSSLPYGMTYFHHPTNRYSDGRLMIDFVAQYLSLPFLPPYRTALEGGPSGVNFAVAGATAIEHGFFVRNNLSFDITPESIGSELGWFEKVVRKEGCVNDGLGECEALFENALIWVGEIGANDYAYSVEGSVSQTSVQNLALRRVSSFLQAILKKGAKYVVVQGLPPTGCLTLAMLLAPPDDRDELGCVKSQNILSSKHNTLLQAEIQGLRRQFPKSVIVYADYYNAYRDIMKNRTKYGFKEAFKVCCGSGGGDFNYDFFSACGSAGSSSCSNPSQYINWDGVHLTEGMYKILSEMMLEGGYSYPSFKDMVSKKVSLV
ncbi:hypothetical protein RND81_01G150900 [Saponaria officinalis]|uniref:Uncharacterized protein n=1 Tax=Saponaria officinalis TaxID=3572 RepID=A0AAW1NEB1_SAPOF